MTKSLTHNEIVLRPPPGTRFTIWGSDVRLEFQRGKEREMVTWLRNWITQYIEPEAIAAEQQVSIAEAQQIATAPIQTPVSNICICGTTNNVHSDVCDMQRAAMRSQPTQPAQTTPSIMEANAFIQQRNAELDKPKAPNPSLRASLKAIADREFAKLTQLANESKSNNEVTNESDNHGKAE